MEIFNAQYQTYNDTIFICYEKLRANKLFLYKCFYLYLKKRSKVPFFSHFLLNFNSKVFSFLSFITLIFDALTTQTSIIIEKSKFSPTTFAISERTRSLGCLGHVFNCSIRNIK